MPDPVNFAERVTDGVAEQTAAFLADVEGSLALGGLVLQSALDLRQAASDMSGTDTVADSVSLDPVAERLVAIATHSIGLLQTMVDAGAIEATETVLGITAPAAPLALTPGSVEQTKPSPVPSPDTATSPKKEQGDSRSEV